PRSSASRSPCSHGSCRRSLLHADACAPRRPRPPRSPRRATTPLRGGPSASSVASPQHLLAPETPRARAYACATTATRDLSGVRPRTGPKALARLREAQVDLARGRIRPARGDDLAVRVEVDPLGPVDVRVPEQ